MLIGPVLLLKLKNVLIKFRQDQFDASSDIEGMFPQHGVSDHEQPPVRFWWRGQPTTNAVYQYTRHIFGAKDFPTCANYSMQRKVQDNIVKYPEATKRVPENFLTDDYLDSIESPERVLNRSKILVHLYLSL